MEIVERIDLLADADQLDRLAGDMPHRERRAAAAVAVHAGQDDAGDAERIVEGGRGPHRILAGQRIGDEQDLVRAGLLLDLGDFGHQLHVDRGPAGRVEDQHVEAAEARRLLTAPRDLHGGLAGDDRQEIDLDLLRQDLQLLHGGGSPRVERGEQHLFLKRSDRRLAIFAVVVVLPEPCRPTIRIATGGVALRSMGSASEPSISTSTSLTILMTIWRA